MRCNTFGYSKAEIIQCGIYAIGNRETQRVYIGHTCTRFGSRWGMHISRLNRGGHPNAPLQSDWLIFGSAAFSFRIVEVIHTNVDKYYFLLREWMYIKAFDNPYNAVLSLETGLLGKYIREGVFDTVPPVEITPNDLLGYTPPENE